jgi:Cu+-exporting ATPase
VLEVVVVIVGLALIVGELWYFLGPRPSPVPSVTSEVQEVRVLVKDGYDPATIFVEAGRPVRLQFYRDETAECSERLVFERPAMEHALPAFETTTIQFTPDEPGDYPFRCGKSILHGRVVAQTGGARARQHLGRGHAKHG